MSSSKRKKPDPEARTVLEELKEAEVLVVTSPENVTRVEKNSDPEVETGMTHAQILDCAKRNQLKGEYCNKAKENKLEKL